LAQRNLAGGVHSFRDEVEKTVFAFRFVFLAIVVCFFLVTVLAVVIPNLVAPLASVGGLPRPCIINLRAIDATARPLALEKHKTNGESINFPDDLKPYIKLNKDGKIPPCPSGGSDTLKTVGENLTCSLGTTVMPAHVVP
jgi:hypothetical protein